MKQTQTLTVAEAAKELDKSYGWVLMLCRMGELKAEKIDDEWAIDRASVKERKAAR